MGSWVTDFTSTREAKWAQRTADFVTGEGHTRVFRYSTNAANLYLSTGAGVDL